MNAIERNDAHPDRVQTVPSRTSISEQLWHDVHERLTAFVAQRVDDPADVADLVQTVFLRVQQYAESVADEVRLLPWLFQVTRNAIADYYRAPGRRREIGSVAPDGTMQIVRSVHRRDDDNGAAVAFEAGSSSAITADDASALAELASCVRPMVQQLPPKYREALTLVEFDELSQVEVAETLGMSVSGMKSRVQRGRAMLREVLLACCDVSRSATGGVLDFEPRSGSGCDTSECAPGSGEAPESVVTLRRQRAE